MCSSNQSINVVESLPTENDKLYAELKHLRQKELIMNNLCEQNKSQNERLTSAHKWQLETQKMYQQSVEKLNETIQSLQQYTNKLNIDNDSLKRKLKDYKQTNSELKKQNDERQTKLNESNQIIKTLQQENAAMIEELNELKSQIINKEILINKYEMESKELQNEINNKYENNVHDPSETATLKLKISKSISNEKSSQTFSSTLNYSIDDKTTRIYKQNSTSSIKPYDGYKRRKYTKHKKHKLNNTKYETSDEDNDYKHDNMSTVQLNTPRLYGYLPSMTSDAEIYTPTHFDDIIKPTEVLRPLVFQYDNDQNSNNDDILFIHKLLIDESYDSNQSNDDIFLRSAYEQLNNQIANDGRDASVSSGYKNECTSSSAAISDTNRRASSLL